MSCILYYSKYCDISKKYLQILSKTNMQKDIHFICIDKRVKDSNNKTYIILENGQKIILPENITRVPALLLLNQGYQVLYGEQILQHFKPIQETAVRVATANNMEPMAFSLCSGGFSNIVSDTYSFLDQNDEDLKATGNGGMRQMHNYVDLNSSNISQPFTMNDNSGDFSTTIKGSNKMSEDSSNQFMEEKMKQMQAQRDADLQSISGNRPPF
jgi:hypothetical protein